MEGGARTSFSSCMGSKKAASNHMLALGVLVVLMGLSHVQAAEAAATAVINLSLVPVEVRARLNATSDGISVVAGVLANVSLPLDVSANARVNLTITNLRTSATISALVPVNATTAIVIVPTPLLNRVSISLVNLVGGVLTLLRTLVSAL